MIKQNLLYPVFNRMGPVLLAITSKFINISNALKTFMPVTMPVASTVRVEPMFTIPVFNAVLVHLNDFEMRMMFPYYRLTDFITRNSFRSI